MKISIGLWHDSENSNPCSAELEISTYGKHISLKLSDSDREVVLLRESFASAVRCVVENCTE